MPLEQDLIAGDKWTFDEDVAEAFSDMLERSIPDYSQMRHLVQQLGAPMLSDGGLHVDYGTSRGDVIADLVSERSVHIGVEVSDPMLEIARTRFADNDRVVIEKRDLRFDPPTVKDVTLVTIVLTLMFTPTNYRAKILRTAVQSLHPGGALILVEKTVAQNPLIDDALQETYHAHKEQMGYTREQIVRKAASLEGVLVPLSPQWNRTMLENAGLEVDTFWQWGPFIGMIGVKPL